LTAMVWKNMTAAASDAKVSVDFRAGPIVIPVSYAQFAIVRKSASIFLNSSPYVGF
jgi:hypothetical protein